MGTTEGVTSTLTLYNEQYYSGITEVEQQNVDVFNAASNNAITLTSRFIQGDFEKSPFFDKMSSVESRRDLTSTSAATVIDITDTERVGVKRHRKHGPIEKTVGSWKTRGMTDQEMSFIIGQQIGKARMQSRCNSAIMSLVGAISGNDDVVLDETGTYATYNLLISVLQKFGDAAGRIVAWVMHSGPYFDLMRDASESKLQNVSDILYNEGNIRTLGKPAIISDSTSLYSGTDYYILGLVAGAADVVDTEQPENPVLERVTGNENIFWRFQDEDAYNVTLKGYSYAETTALGNPTDATLAASSSWTQVSASDKDTAGVLLKVSLRSAVVAA